MHDHLPTILSSTDYARLQGLMGTMIGSRTPFADLLRRKLGSAVIMLPTDIGPDLVSSGRRVRFRVNGTQSDERWLVWDDLDESDTSNLSLQQSRGLALLGLTVDRSITYRTDNRRTEFLQVESVLPEADELIEVPEWRVGSRPSIDRIEARHFGS